MLIVKFMMSIFVAYVGTRLIIKLFGLAGEWLEDVSDDMELRRELRKRKRFDRYYIIDEEDRGQ